MTMVGPGVVDVHPVLVLEPVAIVILEIPLVQLKIVNKVTALLIVLKRYQAAVRH
jgi:hypothetical protein